MKIIVLLFLSLALSQCYLRKDKSNSSVLGYELDESGIDFNTFSNYKEVTTEHFWLNWQINFVTKTNDAEIILKMESLVNDLTYVNLDIWGQEIHQVYFSESYDNNRDVKLSFKINTMEDQGEQGEQLHIPLKRTISKGQIFYITIDYLSNEDANAVSFLNPEQTSTKILPYMYTQCEPIYCRSMMPIQDTPQVKSTYSAQVIVDKELNVYMSANKTDTQNWGQQKKVHYFESTIRVPSYLVSIVIGNIERQQVGKRSYVITEPDWMDGSVDDLSDLEQYLVAVEDYVQIPYIWGTYQIVVMPPSFPIGGMENPLLTFASPSIITGDKSGTTVAIHEIAHSWAGNMVTCGNWSNLWLNEGFTVFLERKAQQHLYGKDYMIMSSIVGNQTFMTDIQGFGLQSNFSSLYPLTAGTNPDDAFSNVPYEKGYQFLYFIQSLIGEKVFQDMMTTWIAPNAFESRVWEDVRSSFEAYIKKNVNNADKILAQIDWELWIKGPGLPPAGPLEQIHFTSQEQVNAIKLADNWILLKGRIRPENWESFMSYTPNEKYVFLNHLYERNADILPRVLSLIDRNYDLSGSTNYEISYRWFRTCILVGYDDVKQDIYQFLGAIGRQKFILPQYKAYVKTGQTAYARTIFENYYNFYHPIARISIEFILGDNVQTVEQ